MASYKPDLIIPTGMIGSYPRPSWFTHQLGGRDIAEAFKNMTHKEAFEDAVHLCVRDQERAGLDLISDGHMWYDEYGTCIGAFLWYGWERIRGFEGRLIPEMQYEANPFVKQMLEDLGIPAVVGRLRRGTMRLAELYRIAQKFSEKPVKAATGAGPVNLARPGANWLKNAYYKDKRDIVFDIAKVMNQELKDVARAGATFIQLDDLGPQFTAALDRDWEWTLEAIGECFKGVDVKSCWHACHGMAWGNPIPIKEPYRKIYPAILETKVDQLALEFASKNFADLKLLKEHPPGRKEIAIGAINVRSLVVETPEQVASGLREALKYVDAKRLYVTTDCGLRALPRVVAFNKLVSMVKGTEIVRKELGLSG